MLQSSVADPDLDPDTDPQYCSKGLAAALFIMLTLKDIFSLAMFKGRLQIRNYLTHRIRISIHNTELNPTTNCSEISNAFKYVRT